MAPKRRRASTQGMAAVQTYIQGHASVVRQAQEDEDIEHIVKKIRRKLNLVLLTKLFVDTDGAFQEDIFAKGVM